MVPVKVFKANCESLKNILRAADVYALLRLDIVRGTDKGVAVAKKVIEESGGSTLLHSKHMFLSKEERTLFEEEEYVSGICQQTIMASYTAIENYLINFFAAKISTSVENKNLSDAILKNLSFRSLDWIKKHYSTFLGIDLPSFKHKGIDTYEESWFHPRDEWHGLKILSDVRNEIAHEGSCTSYPIYHLVDAYSVIHFIERWVMFFECRYGEG